MRNSSVHLTEADQRMLSLDTPLCPFDCQCCELCHCCLSRVCTDLNQVSEESGLEQVGQDQNDQSCPDCPWERTRHPTHWKLSGSIAVEAGPSAVYSIAFFLQSFSVSLERAHPAILLSREASPSLLALQVSVSTYRTTHHR